MRGRRGHARDQIGLVPFCAARHPYGAGDRGGQATEFGVPDLYDIRRKRDTPLISPRFVPKSAS